MAEPVVVVAPMLDEHDGGQVGKKTDFGGKSPGKSPGKGSRRWFKRTLSDQDMSQKAERPSSGKSKGRKESHDSLGGDLQTNGHRSSGGDIRVRPPDAEDDGEGEKGKFIDPKKLQKQNKELLKQNGHLTKQIETLKQEKESLATDKSKLKSDLKSTEKELKKANSSLSSAKSEIERLKAKTHKHSTPGMGEGVEELQERVRQLEAELSHRNAKQSNFRQGVGGQFSQPDGGDGHTENDAGTIQHQLHKEQEASGKLRKENSELRSQVRNLESDLNQLIHLVDTQQEEDVVSNADSSDLSSGYTLSNIIKRRGQNSPSPYASPRNSPALQRKNQAPVEVSTLQNCLKVALEEKAAAEGQRESLHTQLSDVKSQLEEAKEAWEQEKGRLLQQIRELQMHSGNERKQNGEALEHESHQLRKELQEARETSKKDSSHTQTETGSSISSRTNSTQQTPTSVETGSHIGSRTNSTQQRATSEDSTALKTDPVHTERGNDEAKSGKKYMNKGRQISRLKKQQSRENFTSALAVFQSGEAGVSLSKPASKRERSTSETAASGSSVQSSALSAPTDSSKLTTENRSQSVNVVGKPPIHPSSSASGSTHSRQNSADESSQRSPKKRKLSWTIAQKRQSFEQDEESSSTSAVQHSRTASSPTATQTPDSPLHSREVESKEKMQTVEQKKQAEEERARRQKEEKQQKELEAEERRKKELEKKIQQEAEEKERKMKEREERERLRREREEREKERKRELEEKKRQEAEEKEKKRQAELEKKRELEEKKRRERQAQQELQRVKKLEQEKQRMTEREAASKREKEAEEQKKREEEKKRLMLEEEKKRTEASLNRQREQENQERKGETENERKVRLEEERRRAEKEAQAAVEPKPNRRLGSIAMRRQAYEQKASPSSSPPISLRRNDGSKSPAQRPKSMDVGVMLSTPSTTSSSLSPIPQSSNVTSISVKTSKSPQGSPLLSERKEIKEVVVVKTTPITKPSPPISAIGRVPPVSVVTTTSSPPLRRAQTISSTSSIFQAKSTPDLTSVGTGNGTLGSRSPTTQHKMTSPTTPKSPLSEKRMAKTVSFSPSVSTPSKPPGILKPSAPVTTPYMMNGKLSVPGAADMKKAQSLQNIPENAPSDAVSPSHVVRRDPVVQRRARSERAKTTSLSPTDMASLTNILSKMQDKERSPEKPVANGVGPPPRIGSTRPVSMYGSITPTRSEVFPASTSSKPSPHDRKLERRATVGSGLDKTSKRARLLRWCQIITEDYDNISIEDFSRSFSNGLAFCAMLHHFIPDKIPYSTLNCTDKKRNFKIAFEAAESEDIPSLLDVDDMVTLAVPDWKSVMTYVSYIYKRFGANNGTTQQFLL